jgi:5,6-dimethylbenzimidazole synthase
VDGFSSPAASNPGCHRMKFPSFTAILQPQKEPGDRLDVLTDRTISEDQLARLNERPMTGPEFSDAFRADLLSLFLWRRDVRKFRSDPVPPAALQGALEAAHSSPSVGNSQPWRLVFVGSPKRRAAVRGNFVDCNAAALAAEPTHRAALYARLKLEGLEAAPIQIAVFCDRGVTQGHGLGSRTMPEALDYSVAAMITHFWLAARAHGLGVGWVSILDPERIKNDLGVPAHYRFIAYLCVGWPEEEHVEPELARVGWQERTQLGRYILHV